MAEDEDPNHITQVQEIAPKQTLTRTMSAILIPRRLSRAQPPARGLVPSNSVGANVVVGVSVNTIEAEHEEEEEEAGSERQDAGSPALRSGAMVHVGDEPPRALRSQSSRSSLNPQKSSSLWREKAKNLSRKFRRKSGSKDIISPPPTPATPTPAPSS